MPLFLRQGETDRTPDVEGTYVEPSPHRPPPVPRSERLRRLARYDLWYRWKRDGMSLAQISLFADKPISTVADGIRVARRRLADQEALDRCLHVPALVPFFGCRPLTPDRPKSCPVCKDHVASDSLVCGKCDRASERNERRLDAQRRQAEALERRTAANWSATARKPAPAPITLPMGAPA